MELRILGPLEVEAAGRPVALGGARARSCLALMILHAREPVPTEVFLETLWGDGARPSGRKTLQVQLSRLRDRLGAEADRLVTTPAGYRLDIAPEELDAGRFERLCARAADEDAATAAATLAEALALWRGPVLADLRYEPFAQAEISRLEGLRDTALEDRLEAEFALDRPGVLAEIEALATTMALRERLVELQMRALYRAGRHVEALAAYREARRRLDEELGLQPGPALRELERA